MKRKNSKPKMGKGLPYPFPYAMASGFAKAAPDRPGDKRLRGTGMPVVHGQAVERLASGLRPVKSPTPIWGQWLLWVAGMSVLAALVFSRVPLRGDLSGNGPSLALGGMVFLIFMGAALAAWGALDAGIPGGEAKGRWKVGSAMLLYGLAFLLFLLCLPWETADYSFHPALSSCFVVVLLVGLVSWIGLGLLIRHNAPLNPKRAGVWAGVSAFLVGLGFITLHCGSHNLVHIFLEHFLPVLAYSWLTGWLGYRWLCSWKRKPLSK